MLKNMRVPAVFTVELAENVLNRISAIVSSTMQTCGITDLCVIIGDTDCQELAKKCYGNASLHENIARACLERTVEMKMSIGVLRREYAELATCSGMPTCDGESYIDGGIVTAVSGNGASRDIEAVAKLVTAFARAAIQEASVKFQENSGGATFIR